MKYLQNCIALKNHQIDQINRYFVLLESYGPVSQKVSWLSGLWSQGKKTINFKKKNINKRCPTSDF